MEFARLLAAGCGQSEAYRKAFHCDGQSAAAVRSCAWRLAKNADVLEFVAQLRRKADRSALLDRQRRMELLSSAALGCSEAGDVANLVRCVAELNKMDGAYEPLKQELTGKDGAPLMPAADVTEERLAHIAALQARFAEQAKRELMGVDGLDDVSG